jgi:hypothetical protein
VNNRLFQALLAFFFIFTGSAYALDPKDNLLEIGFNYFNYDYSEKVSPPHKSDEEGNVPGLQLNYSFRKPGEIYINVFGELAWGDTDYDGSLQDGTPAKGTTENTFARYDLSLGYTFLFLKSIKASPFVGIGSAQWNRELQEHTENYFNERYDWSYVPVGIFITWEPTSRISIGAKAVYRYMFSSEIKINGAVASKFARSLGDEYEYALEMPVSFRVSEHLNLSVVPSYNKRKFGKSSEFPVLVGDEVYGAYEPASDAVTKSIALRIGYLF